MLDDSPPAAIAPPRPKTAPPPRPALALGPPSFVSLEGSSILGFSEHPPGNRAHKTARRSAPRRRSILRPHSMRRSMGRTGQSRMLAQVAAIYWHNLAHFRDGPALVGSSAFLSSRFISPRRRLERRPHLSRRRRAPCQRQHRRPCHRRGPTWASHW